MHHGKTLCTFAHALFVHFFLLTSTVTIITFRHNRNNHHIIHHRVQHFLLLMSHLPGRNLCVITIQKIHRKFMKFYDYFFKSADINFIKLLTNVFDQCYFCSKWQNNKKNKCTTNNSNRQIYVIRLIFGLTFWQSGVTARRQRPRLKYRGVLGSFAMSLLRRRKSQMILNIIPTFNLKKLLSAYLFCSYYITIY